MTLTLLSILVSHQVAPIDEVRLAIDLSKTVTPVSRSLYGIFFEEINQAGDGGLYAELIRNRGLEGVRDANLPAGWSATESGGTVSIQTANPLNETRRHSIRIERRADDAKVWIANEGFWGVPLRKGGEYRLTMWVRGNAPVEARLEGNTGPVARMRLSAPGERWRRVERILRPSAEVAKGRLVIEPSATGTVNVAYASLMPTDTWKRRANGLRKDLANHVALMKPAFVRFPGGCYIEGGDRLADRFNWKQSVGPVHKRGSIARSMWGYPTTYGLGYHEYLQWCEDLNAEPMFVASAGMSHRETVPMDQMGPYVQEALDAIEYANGPVSSKWGALRAKNGHPKPFKLKYVEIGNENGGPAYAERYALIAKAIGAKYPDIVRIAGLWGGYPRNAPVDLLDEHYYSNPAFFWDNATRYDHYDRKGPKIYVGEYAVTQGSGTGNLDAALGEAAFMTGMERNSDIVRLSSYAPLFVNVNNRQWNPNAIVFDANRSYGTPSYHAQAMFANNLPDRVVATKVDLPPVPYAPVGAVGLQTWRTHAEFKDISLSVDGAAVPFDLPGMKVIKGNWKAEGGAVSQTEIAENNRALFPSELLTGSKRWEYSVKARRVSGDEGFILVFLSPDERNYLQWNVGGWNNTQHAFERTVGGQRSVISQVPGSIETGRWYEARIVGEGGRIRAYLDGKLVQEMDDRPSPRFAVVSGIDDRRKELVIKAVNGTSGAVKAQLDISGGRLVGKGSALVLDGDDLNAENSFAQPNRIAPRKSTLDNLPPIYSFPPRSVTILRIPIAK